MTSRGVFLFIAALLLPVQSNANPLSMVVVNATAVSCVFNPPPCTPNFVQSIEVIPLPPSVTGTARLVSRTYAGLAGTPGAGKTGYEYRVDLTQTQSNVKKICVTALKFEFGPVTPLAYKQNGPPRDVFEVTSGLVGPARLKSADQSGKIVTFLFSPSVCTGSFGANGQTSSFFGLASAAPPISVQAEVKLSGGPAFTAASVQAPK